MLSLTSRPFDPSPPHIPSTQPLPYRAAAATAPDISPTSTRPPLNLVNYRDTCFRLILVLQPFPFFAIPLSFFFPTLISFLTTLVLFSHPVPV